MNISRFLRLPRFSLASSSSTTRHVRFPIRTVNALVPNNETKTTNETIVDEMTMKDTMKETVDIVDSNGFPVQYNLTEYICITDANGFPIDGINPVVINIDHTKHHDTIVTDHNGFPV